MEIYLTTKINFEEATHYQMVMVGVVNYTGGNMSKPTPKRKNKKRIKRKNKRPVYHATDIAWGMKKLSDSVKTLENLDKKRKEQRRES